MLSSLARWLRRHLANARRVHPACARWRPPIHWQELSVAYYLIRRRELKQMQYKRISADCHLDLIWLPPELFTSEAPRDLKDRMPYVTDGPRGKEWVARNGASFGLIGGVGSGGRPYVPGVQSRADRMAETGLYDEGMKGVRRPGDPELRVKE